MSISVFDLFKVGIGPSSSHTVGPMKAAREFVLELAEDEAFDAIERVCAQMFGSLAATGVGHGTRSAVVMGLEAEAPESVDVTTMSERVQAVFSGQPLQLAGRRAIAFDRKRDLILNRREELPFHPNGMRFYAYDKTGYQLSMREYYSVGGGFILNADEQGNVTLVQEQHSVTYPFSLASELMALCEQHDKSIPQIMLANESAWRSEEETRSGLLHLWHVMQNCIQAGMNAEGVLPGGLNVKRRAADLHKKLLDRPERSLTDPLTVLDWVTLYALAVNEENAAGGRIVTAPTNGAAGIIPAVLSYYQRFVIGASDAGIVDFLLTAGAIGILYKENASISGAEVGCQGEVGSACSMAAGALAQVMGGTPRQVENAAEIAMEHNLGLTCDPIGGLVQVPCIERNAMASIKAIHAARMALRGDGDHFVPLDKVIRTMRDTGRDMQDKYKETARGGLAVNVVDVPVNIIEC